MKTFVTWYCEIGWIIALLVGFGLSLKNYTASQIWIIGTLALGLVVWWIKNFQLL